MYNDKIILTPQDILDKDFKMDARGFRPQEVDSFLDTIIKDYTQFNSIIKKLDKENASLVDENNRLRTELRKIKELQDVSSETGSRSVNNIDLLRRLSQLEKIVYGKSE